MVGFFFPQLRRFIPLAQTMTLALVEPPHLRLYHDDAFEDGCSFGMPMLLDILL